MNGASDGIKQNMKTLGIGRIRQTGSRTCEDCGKTVPIMERTDTEGNSHEESVCLHCVNQETRSRLPKIEDLKKEKVKRFGEKFEMVPKKLIGKTVSGYIHENDTEKTMKSEVTNYIMNFGKTDFNSLVLKGPMGVGKSHLAYAACMELRKRGFSTMFISSDDFLKLIRSTFDRDSELTEKKIFEMIEQLDLLVFDEIGAEYINKKDGYETWASEKILKVTDLREDQNNIYTTNYSAPQMEGKYGPIQGGRIASRMIAGAKRIQVDGRDRRAKSF